MILNENELKLFVTELIQDVSPSNEYEMDLIDELSELRNNSRFSNDTIMKYYDLGNKGEQHD